MQILELMKEANSLLQQILEATLQERSYLRARNLDAFAQCVDHKELLIHSLETNHDTRSNWVKSRGNEFSRSGFLSAIADLKDKAAIEQELSAMESLLGECKRQTDINNTVVGRTLSVTAKYLDILKGHQQDKQVYSPSGKATHHAASHVLGKA
ncbi:flagellar protein FlgN [Pokkaliibacter sp. MBI-7]|uniref:flagellar protein FlgN n=1 Tax=Pokkaliibacter sp. MBI-7 TaxID=3040600 RepID=UPI002449C92F|nr:flagellar protein FlgN [Pokkaliibacter sp. MBI-7]MDH2431333.1 flagellar protein FlgN [Pokkaliibacter sp. MBI-7]